MAQFTSNGFGVAQGSQLMFSDVEENGPMWSGEGTRMVRHVVTFAESFRSPPLVQVGISLWDVDHSANLRAEIRAENVTGSGFNLVFKTWGDTRIARIRAEWMAIGPVHDTDMWQLD